MKRLAKVGKLIRQLNSFVLLQPQTYFIKKAVYNPKVEENRLVDLKNLAVNKYLVAFGPIPQIKSGSTNYFQLPN